MTPQSHLKLNSKELRKVDQTLIAADARSLRRNPIYLILEDIYDTYNIGGLFRLADGLAVTHMYLVGQTTPPPNNRIHKASCGTYKVVPWTYTAAVDEALAHIQSTTGIRPLTLAIEQSPSSIPYQSLDLNTSQAYALIVGNETTGVTTSTLESCDHTIEIPMWGINKSLNVIVSAAIVSYHLLHTRSPSS